MSPFNPPSYQKDALDAYRNRWTRNGTLILKLNSDLGALSEANGRSERERLVRALRARDLNGTRAIGYEEFSRALAEFGLKLRPEEANKVSHSFDTDNDGVVDIGEFLLALSPTVSPAALAAIAEAQELVLGKKPSLADQEAFQIIQKEKAKYYDDDEKFSAMLFREFRSVGK